MYSVTLPSTLKTVEGGAFWVEPRVPVGRNNQETNRDNDFDWDLEYRDMDVVVCNAIVPPVLIDYPFANPPVFHQLNYPSLLDDKYLWLF